MRTALCMAIGLAVVVSGVPASLAQDSQGLDHGKSAGTGQTHQKRGSNRGISVAVPIGGVSVGPKLDGEPIYVRRTTGKEGMTIVEVSTTPFMPVLASNQQPSGAVLRPDQPAGW